jgi:hypothetical protein
MHNKIDVKLLSNKLLNMRAVKVEKITFADYVIKLKHKIKMS